MAKSKFNKLKNSLKKSKINLKIKEKKNQWNKWLDKFRKNDTKNTKNSTTKVTNHQTKSTMLTVSSSFMTPGRFTVDETDKSYAEEISVMAYHIDETSQIKNENPIEVKNKLPLYLKQNCG